MEHSEVSDGLTRGLRPSLGTIRLASSYDCRSSSVRRCWHGYEAEVGAVEPLIHIRCMMTASFLANATLAHFAPRRRAMAMAQAFNDDQATARVTMTWAVSNRAPRTETSESRGAVRTLETQTFIAGLRSHGLTAPWVIDRPMNRQLFEAYVQPSSPLLCRRAMSSSSTTWPLTRARRPRRRSAPAAHAVARGS